MKPKLSDFLPDQENLTTNVPVRMSAETKKEFREALKRQHLSAQKFLLAHIKLFIAEMKNKK